MLILINGDVSAEQKKCICALSPGIRLVDTQPNRGTSLPKEALMEAEIIYTSEVNFDLSEAPSLRWIQLDSASVRHIAHLPIVQTAIPIANVSGAYSTSVAECAIGMLLALTRRIALSCAFQGKSRWPEDYAPFKGDDLYGKTLGIVGYGSIGRQIGRLARAMGLKVLACKQHPEIRHDTAFSFPGTGDPEGGIPEAWYGPSQIQEMFRHTDFAVITLPHTDATEGLIGRRELEALPARGYLVNVGRGAVIVETELIECLRAGRLAGAALDVFASEPLSADSPLWKLPNVLVAPHIGSWTKLQSHHAAEVLIENISRDLKGEPLLNLIDKRLMY
jgi:phosphoglycerate dehydrogenase-like enzyme